MKGQMLILTAFLVVIFLILIRIESNYTEELERAKEMPNIFISFENINNELEKSGEIAITLENYGIIKNFCEFVKEREDFEVFFAISEFHNQTLNITLGNFLNRDLQNIQVSQNLTGETKIISSLSSGEMDWVNFTYSPSGETLIEINVTTNNLKESFSAYAGDEYERYVTIFYDSRLKFENSTLNKRFAVDSKTK